MSLYTRIRKWFQPYWSPIEKPKKIKKKKETKPKKADKPKQSSEAKQLQDKQSKNQLIMPVIEAPRSLENVINSRNKPRVNRIWYYHDQNVHQIFAHLAPLSGYTVTTRDDEARKKLKPLIYPIHINKPFDRTHVLPIGFHGSENDPRLVIGWDSDQNRHELAEFEQKNKKHPFSIYWFTEIRKTDYGAVWKYVIYSAEDMRLVDSLELKYGTPKAPIQMKWK
jgi:hypothetical protein